MSGFKLTVRQGSRVERGSFEDLDAAMAALEEHAKAIRKEGPLEPRRMLRDFEPGDQVAGRVEISTGGFLRRGVDAGVDVMGDGRFVAFRGGVSRSPLEAGDGPFAAVRRALVKA